jgi:very-short-patch-repair endonuclease
LCVEVDGEAHNRGDQPGFDEARDAWLRLHGVETLRVTASDVLRTLEGVITHIIDTTRPRLPLHHSPKRANGPPPRSGEA